MPPIDQDAGKTEVRGRVHHLLDSNQVVVFSKTYCPYCVTVKDLFKELDVQCQVVELDLLEDVTIYMDVLAEMTGQTTVPSVFIHKKHLGGCDSTLQVRMTGIRDYSA